MTKDEIVHQLTELASGYYDACLAEGIEEGLEPNTSDFILATSHMLMEGAPHDQFLWDVDKGQDWIDMAFNLMDVNADGDAIIQEEE
jgi:hypothetical protein